MKTKKLARYGNPIPAATAPAKTELAQVQRSALRRVRGGNEQSSPLPGLRDGYPEG